MPQGAARNIIGRTPLQVDVVKYICKHKAVLDNMVKFTKYIFCFQNIIIPQNLFVSIPGAGVSFYGHVLQILVLGILFGGISVSAVLA